MAALDTVTGSGSAAAPGVLASGSSPPSANALIAQATDPKTGHLDTRTIASAILALRQSAPAQADALTDQVEKQLLSSSPADASRLHDDLRMAGPGTESAYSPSRTGWHDYTAGPNVVCAASLHCSRSEIEDQLVRFAVPGQDPAHPLSNKAVSTVYAPGTHIAVGTVRTYVSPDGLTVKNVTQPGHIFYNGQVVRQASQGRDGSWSVTTRGTGNDVYPGMADLNQLSGRGIFDGLDRNMAMNIAQHHGAALH